VNSVIKRVLVFSLLFSMMNLLSLPQNTTNSAEEKRKLLTLLENVWNQAQLARDGKALDGLVPDTYVYTDSDGTVMNKAQFIADTQDRSYRLTTVTNNDVKVYLYDSAAVVIGAYHTKGIYKGNPFDHRGRFTDTWVFQNNQWQCVATHTNLIQK